MTKPNTSWHNRVASVATLTTSRQDYHVEQVKKHRRIRRSVVLKCVERGVPGFIKRDNLSIYDSLVRQLCQSVYKDRVLTGEVIVIAGAEMHLACCLEGDGAEAIQLDLKG